MFSHDLDDLAAPLRALDCLAAPVGATWSAEDCALASLAMPALPGMPDALAQVLRSPPFPETLLSPTLAASLAALRAIDTPAAAAATARGRAPPSPRGGRGQSGAQWSPSHPADDHRELRVQHHAARSERWAHAVEPSRGG